MKYLKDIAINEKENRATEIAKLVEEIWNRSNIINWLQDEGYMDETGHVGWIGIDDVKSEISDQFDVRWKSLGDMEGEFKNFLSACEELSKLYPASKFKYSK